jgi:hypothetical protein
MKTITRYAITRRTKDGLRVLYGPNQGRFHHDTKESAEAHLAAMLTNNSKKTLDSVCEGQSDTLRVDAIECYQHGDAVRTVLGLEGENAK